MTLDELAAKVAAMKEQSDKMLELESLVDRLMDMNVQQSIRVRGLVDTCELVANWLGDSGATDVAIMTLRDAAKGNSNGTK